MTEAPEWHLFDVYGVELEYMIVACDKLSILPVADQLLGQLAGSFPSEIERPKIASVAKTVPRFRFPDEVEVGDVAWSNELVLHVIELKTNGPVAQIDPLPTTFQNQIRQVNGLLKPLGGRLMPTGMHPWMEPTWETRLWPHQYAPIYQAYHRIFNCAGHGWANLQATHLNLPFIGDDEFGQLHAAIRLLLPVLPALAASSPVANSRITGYLDNRLEVYRTNANRIASLTGDVIPEPVFTHHDYQRQILEPMYDAIRPHDRSGILQHEFLNSRGAIARFDRGAIEIRLLDMQECPAADVAVCGATANVLKVLTSQRWSDLRIQQRFDTQRLVRILLACIRDADQMVIEDRGYLDLFGFPPRTRSCTAAELWHHLCETTIWSADSGSQWSEPFAPFCSMGHSLGPSSDI